jgi:SEC-C motif
MDEVEAGIDQDGRAFLRGLVRVLSRHGHEYGAFRVCILYPAKFPERGRLPAVYLESHRQWQKGGDSHIEPDRKLCLFVPGEADIDWAQVDSSRKLIASLRVFLFKEHRYQKDLAQWNAFHVGQKPQWLGPARAHGIAGIREVVRAQGGWERNAPCPCGSGSKYKRCCLQRVEARK